MKYAITAILAAITLFMTTTAASAQHAGAGHQGGYSGGHDRSDHHDYHYAPVSHGRYDFYRGGTYVYPATSYGVGVYAAPGYVASVPVYSGQVYNPSYYVAPDYTCGHGHYNHHGHH